MDEAARRWLRAQVERLGDDADLVRRLPRDEVEAGLDAEALMGLRRTIRRRLDAPATAGAGPRGDAAPDRAAVPPAARRRRAGRTPLVAALALLLLLAGVWTAGRLTQPPLTRLADLGPYDAELAALTGPPAAVATKGVATKGMATKDAPAAAAEEDAPAWAEALRTGLGALDAAAPAPLAPVPRADADRARHAARALSRAYDALAARPAAAPVPTAALTRAEALPPGLATAGALRAFVALAAAHAHLLGGDAAAARAWLARVEPGTPWHADATRLHARLDARPDVTSRRRRQ